MKLDDVRRFVEVPQPFSPESQQKIHEYLISIGIDPSNLYQELEMSSPFVNTHRDVTYSPRPVSLHRAPSRWLVILSSQKTQTYIKKIKQK